MKKCLLSATYIHTNIILCSVFKSSTTQQHINRHEMAKKIRFCRSKKEPNSKSYKIILESIRPAHTAAIKSKLLNYKTTMPYIF